MVISECLVNECPHLWWIHTPGSLLMLGFCFCGLLSLDCPPSNSVISENFHILKVWFDWFLLCSTPPALLELIMPSYMFLWCLLLIYLLLNLINIILTGYMVGILCAMEVTTENALRGKHWEAHSLMERCICKNIDTIQSVKCCNQGENKMP